MTTAFVWSFSGDLLRMYWIVTGGQMLFSITICINVADFFRYRNSSKAGNNPRKVYGGIDEQQRRIVFTAFLKWSLFSLFLIKEPHRAHVEVLKTQST